MRTIAGLALIFSLAALGLSTWNAAQADARAGAALRRREAAIIERYRPKVIHFCREFGLKEEPSPDADRIEELLAPLEKLFDGLEKK